ncbi:conserved hypothetical protein [Tenacibaculum sp. 190524A05c]|uniref:carboxypeptidase-like regulatory domain-containing protein n=1 Tax=Tenacibaculum platacis TaxID=3137852 RepID=UPI0031FAE28B
MKSKFTLEINKPCSEKFSGFKKTELGGFCGSCQKEVIDFTGWSSRKILEYFENNTNKRTCGRMTDYQLGTYAKPTKINRLNIFKNIGIACISLFSLNTAYAQKNNPKVETLELKHNELKKKNLEHRFTVSGIVSDDSGPLPGVSIQLENSIVGTESDFDGKFVFPQKLKKGDVLIFSFVGMDTQKIKIENDTTVSNIELKVNIEMAGCVFLGEVTVKKPFKSKKKFWKKN